jgi:hypothetical protein
MRRLPIILSFVLHLIALSFAVVFTAFALIVGRKFRTIQDDFEGSTGFPLIDGMANLSAWVAGDASANQAIPGAVWVIGVPLIGFIASLVVWRRVPPDANPNEST